MAITVTIVSYQFGFRINFTELSSDTLALFRIGSVINSNIITMQVFIKSTFTIYMYNFLWTFKVFYEQGLAAWFQIFSKFDLLWWSRQGEIRG
jgi:hypothetical protein